MVSWFIPIIISFTIQILIADASFLDEWSFDQFQDLLHRSHNDSKLRGLIMQERVVVFLHLLGCDTNGHAHRPHSTIYSDNVRVVDRIAQRVQNLFDDYFGDDQTAYIFTADHGISDKGLMKLARIYFILVVF